MNSAQESKNELDAAIRYAENAISSAKQTIESMEFRQQMAQKQYSEKTGREEALENHLDDMRASAFEDAKTIEQLNKEVQLQKDIGQGYYDDMMTFKEKADSLAATIQRLKEDQPTMPVIPKAVAIAIFREGVQSGVNDACCELEGQTINISEEECVGSFSVTFERDVHLDEELDLDWMRDKVGQYNEEWVVGALKGLCEKEDFECRIHGIDDQGDDSKSA